MYVKLIVALLALLALAWLYTAARKDGATALEIEALDRQVQAARKARKVEKDVEDADPDDIGRLFDLWVQP